MTLRCVTRTGQKQYFPYRRRSCFRKITSKNGPNSGTGLSILSTFIFNTVASYGRRWCMDQEDNKERGFWEFAPGKLCFGHPEGTPVSLRTAPRARGCTGPFGCIRTVGVIPLNRRHRPQLRAPHIPIEAVLRSYRSGELPPMAKGSGFARSIKMPYNGLCVMQVPPCPVPVPF